MNQRRSDLLFYSFLLIILIGNCILLAALYQSFFTKPPIHPSNGILPVFGAELIGGLFFVWKRITSEKYSDDTPTTLLDASKQSIEGYGEGKNLEEIRLNMGSEFLAKAVDAKKSIQKRKELAEQAKEIFEGIQPDSPIYYVAQFNLATALRELDEPKKAIKVYESVEAQILRKDGINKLLKECKKEDEAALTEINRIALSDVLAMKGNLYTTQGNYDEAYKLLKKSWELDPTRYVKLYTIYELAKARKKRHEAAVWYEILRKHPDFAVVLSSKRRT